MQHISREKEQLPRLQCVRLAAGRDDQSTFDTLHRDFAAHFMRWQRLAGVQHQAHHFEIDTLEEGSRSSSRHAASEWLHVDGLAGLGMFGAHRVEYALAAPCVDLALMRSRGTATLPKFPRPALRTNLHIVAL